jgi:hypothetical protein
MFREKKNPRIAGNALELMRLSQVQHLPASINRVAVSQPTRLL